VCFSGRRQQDGAEGVSAVRRTRNTFTLDCRNRRKGCAAGAAAWFFHEYTLYPPCGHQSDAVQSGGAFASANMCFPEDVMVTAGIVSFSRQTCYRLVVVMVTDT